MTLSPSLSLFTIHHPFFHLSIYHLWQRRQWHPTPVLLPGKSHGWRSLEGCSPWGHWGSDTTERLHFHFSLSCTGEGNGNPLQCSCIENPRDGGAWWAAVYRVAQSRTWLKWLSSSSIHMQQLLVNNGKTHSKIFAWRIPGHRAWQAIVHGVTELDTTEVTEHTHIIISLGLFS